MRASIVVVQQSAVVLCYLDVITLIFGSCDIMMITNKIVIYIQVPPTILLVRIIY